jgi:hypothetical protein
MTTNTPAAAPITAEPSIDVLIAMHEAYWGLNLDDTCDHQFVRRSWGKVYRAALSAPVAAQPAASGVDALWVENAMRLAEELETAAILYGDSKPESEREGQCCERMLAAREALRAHLSTALKGEPR